MRSKPIYPLSSCPLSAGWVSDQFSWGEQLARLPIPRFTTAFFKQLNIAHHHASVYGFTHIVNGEEGDLGGIKINDLQLHALAFVPIKKISLEQESSKNSRLKIEPTVVFFYKAFQHLGPI